LSTLKYLKYEYFRGTIFDCMDLISKWVIMMKSI
jgi:hypothetical protein